VRGNCGEGMVNSDVHGGQKSNEENCAKGKRFMEEHLSSSTCRNSHTTPGRCHQISCRLTRNRFLGT
jgi:hypothetical protein